MSQVFKLSCWQSGANNRWYCNDTALIGKWYIPMRILNLSIEDFIEFLINKCHAHIVHYCEQTDCLIFYFNKEKDAKNFCSIVNKESKKKNFTYYR